MKMKKNSKYILELLLLSCFLSACSLDMESIYVSPTGNDTNLGTEQQPFSTIERARKEVRLLKSENPQADITVFLRGGEYRIQNTTVFNLEDSGGLDQTITYTAYPGEKPVITSKIPIENWEKLTVYSKELPKIAKGKVWVADISFIDEIKKNQPSSPSVATQSERAQLFYTLYSSGEILQRARGETFSMRKTELIDRSDHKTFMFPDGAIHNWSDLYNAELNIIPLRKWVSNILPIADIDEKTGIGHTAVPGTYTLIKHYENSKNGVGHIENVMAVLDEPGEWVIDSKHNKLYLWPKNGKPKDISAPVLTELVRVEGLIDYGSATDRPVKNIVFKGLTFTGADRFLFQGQTGWGVQHDWERFDSPSAMLRFRGSENCVVQDCHFTTASSSGIRFDLHGQSNRVEGNHIEYLGGVGILLAGYGPGTKDVNHNNTITNNSIHDIGEMYHGSPGIFVWQSSNNKVVNNLISHVPYTGICITGRIVWDTEGAEECSNTIRWHEVGGKESIHKYADRGSTWNLRKGFLHSRDNMVSRNDINNVMEVCGDGNAIYISGAGGGNQIVENYCHDAPSFRVNSAIRCDDDQEETTIKRNIMYRIGGNAEGLMIKGKNDLIENLLVDLRTVEGHRGYLRFYDGIVKGSLVQRNIFYSTIKGQNAFRIGVSRKGGSAPDLKDTKADFNMYYSTVDEEWGAKHLQHYQEHGVEMNSSTADPMFVDVENGNFQFKAESPALKLGLEQPIKIELVGPQASYRKQFYLK